MFVSAARPSLSLVENIRRQQIAWLTAILEATGWKRQNLAVNAGLSPATFSKFFNDPDNLAELDHRTVQKIAAIAPLPPYQTELAPLSRGVGEREAVPYEPQQDDGLTASMTRALMADRNGIVPWVLGSRALETAGYLPGDIMLVNLNGTPRDGDVVCAQVYDRYGKAETIFRLYERPYLVSATFDRVHFKPLYVDDDRVMVRGVVEGSYRPRAALAS